MVEGVHLVGSVPLPGAEQVFQQVARGLGDRIDRLADGETGLRRDWIAWQYAVLTTTAGLEPIPGGDRAALRPRVVRLRADAPAELRFGPLGYADAALASYAIFERLQRARAIPSGVRFQVSLPTPLAPVSIFVHPSSRAAVEPAYEARLIAELRRILKGIPHERLAIQWDVAVELGLVEKIWPAHFPDVEEGVLERLVRLGEAVPPDVHLGYHLCYGDFGHHHFMEPADAGTLVRLANALAARGRPLAWLHMPVPLGWTAAPAFAPLSGLALGPRTHLYLGLVHLSDGEEGTRQRIALASDVVPRFGVATECGWGRRSPASVAPLMALHLAVSDPVR